MARRNFFVLASRFLLSWAAVILLSEATSAEEVRKCYWCGPLAEQVHKSRRAPSCKTIENLSEDYMTECEPGLRHCAVVATSPPHMESRFCVKIYQDECYPLYCNTTKTWKMTCPCQGDMCNGPNTDRENEAFAVLAKLVAKTKNIRIKKSVEDDEIVDNNQLDHDVTNGPHAIKETDNKENIQTNPDIHMEESKREDMPNDKPTEEQEPTENHDVKTQAKSDIKETTTTTAMPITMKTTILENKDKSKSKEHEIVDNNQLNYDVTNGPHVIKETHNKDHIQTNPDIQMDEPKREDMPNDKPTEEQEPTENHNMKTEAKSDIEETTTTTAKPITMTTTVLENKDNSKSNENAPMPGALQQNVEKTPTEHVITTESTTMAMETTTNMINMTVAPTNTTKNNSAVFVEFNVMCILLGSAVNLL